jgi:hypothetical protein
LRTLVVLVGVAAVVLSTAVTRQRSKPKFLTGPPPRAGFNVARLKYDGVWNINPQAISHLMTAMRGVGNRGHYEAAILPRDPSLDFFLLLYVHGNGTFALSPDDLAALRRHLTPGGGTLFADAACGSAKFDAAFRQLVVTLFPNEPLVPIPPNDELYSAKLYADLSKVQYTEGAGGGKGFPQLEGVKIDGRWAIIYSKYGIGCALEQDHQGGCKGYTHDDSLKIGANVVIYSILP